MTATASTVRRRRYVDSVSLMRVAKRLTEGAGVADAAAMMATPANRRSMRAAGFAVPDDADPDDLVITVRADSIEHADLALARVDALLATGPTDDAAPRTVDAALELHPDLNLVAISLPAGPALAEARRALAHGLHVFLFSSGIGLEDELALKQDAERRGLIVMGPDCGTSIIAGAGLGFANAVRPGPIGVIGAAGTGVQAITTLVHERGSGISHAIGTGGRDLTDAIGGITTFAALRALDDDPTTDLIVLVAKSIGTEVHRRLLDTTARMTTPVLTCLLAAAGGDASTLRDAADLALEGISPGSFTLETGGAALDRSVLPLRWGPRQRTIRGVFAGGSFCAEAQAILQDRGAPVTTQAPSIDGDPGVHHLLDMGAEEHTTGRPHPMIDPGLRRAQITDAGNDPRVAVLLLDIVLGYGAASDPAGDLADVIIAARTHARLEGRPLLVLASICGTDLDPQGADAQRKTLTDAGVVILPTSAHAAEAAVDIVRTIP